MGCGERGFEVRDETVKGPGQCFPPRHENIVVAGKTIKGKDCLRRGAKPPFGTVALDSASDFPGGREADADGAVSIFHGWACFERQAGHNAADPFGRAKEIDALLQTRERRLVRACRRTGCRIDQAESFLRP
jgi:hypothetical protein